MPSSWPYLRDHLSQLTCTRGYQLFVVAACTHTELSHTTEPEQQQAGAGACLLHCVTVEQPSQAGLFRARQVPEALQASCTGTMESVFFLLPLDACAVQRCACPRTTATCTCEHLVSILPPSACSLCIPAWNNPAAGHQTPAVPSGAQMFAMFVSLALGPKAAGSSIRVVSSTRQLI